MEWHGRARSLHSATVSTHPFPIMWVVKQKFMQRRQIILTRKHEVPLACENRPSWWQNWAPSSVLRVTHGVTTVGRHAAAQQFLHSTNITTFRCFSKF